MSSRPKSALDEALDEGTTENLPPNQPRGILGEAGVDIRKVDTFEPDGNAGVSQEVDFPVVLMAVLIAYAVFFPAAYVILWRSKHFSRRAKVVLSAMGVVGIVAAALALRTGR